MIVSIKGIRIPINHKIVTPDRNNIIVDDLLDGDESVDEFTAKHHIPSKENVTRFTAVTVLKG